MQALLHMTSDTTWNMHSYSKYIYKCCGHQDIKIIVEWNPVKRHAEEINRQLAIKSQMCIEGETFLHNTVYLLTYGILLLSASISTQSSWIPVWFRSTNWKSSLKKKKNPTWTYMNTTARRIENLFQKSGIVFLHLPVITAQPPEAERGNAQSPLLCHAFVN